MTEHKKLIQLDGNLTLSFLAEYLENSQSYELEIHKSSREKMLASKQMVNQIVKEEKPVYSINTGFGALCTTQISPEDTKKLQYNILRSHASGMGVPYDERHTKAIMLIRASCLMKGHSGVSIELVDRILFFLNHNILPMIPEKGSLGASGDLAPLSHLALTLIGEGEVFVENKKYKTQEILKQFQIEPCKLGAKDGLALINGTAVMLSLCTNALFQAEKLFLHGDLAGALSLEAMKGSRAPFHKNISNLRPHPGQLATIKNLSLLLSDSEINDSHANCSKVQDFYSLRCIPQVHGACKQTLYHTQDILQVELSAVTDNPLIFPEENLILSGGNFHGESLALVMDYMALGVSEYCSLSERRIDKLMNPSFSGHQAFMAKNPGLESGLMVSHYLTAALVSENKILSHPAVIDSIPTSNDQEDHVSMGVHAGLKLRNILNNLTTCLAVELLAGTQGLEYLRPLKTTKPLEAAYEIIRSEIPPITCDRVFANDIETLKNIVHQNTILKTVQDICGEFSL